MKRTLIFLAVTAMVVILLTAFDLTNNNDKIGERLKRNLELNISDNYTIYIYLRDKGPNAQSKLSSPLSLVSQRSLDRRAKVLPENKIVDMTDVPLYDVYVNKLAGEVNKIRTHLKWFNAVTAEVTRQQIYDVCDYDFVEKIEIVESYCIDKDSYDLLSGEETGDNLKEQKTNYTDMPLDSLNYGYGRGYTQISQINVNQVHNEGIYGQGILIGHFDAGYYNLTHLVFTTLPMKIVRRYDFHTQDTVLTQHSHGTATLSLIGGYHPGYMVGPAFKSDFILCRTEVGTFERPVEMDYWIAAMEWVDSLGADLISSSLGYLTFDTGYPSYTWQDMNGRTLPISIAAALAAYKGIVVNNSAGNSGSSTHNTLGGPADADSIITVGAVTSTGVRASFSSVGPTTDTPARIKPDVMAMGSQNKTAKTSGNGYDTTGSGTSYSCPLAAGVSSLVLSANKDLTPLQVRGIIRKFASQNSNPDNLMGWGIINAKLAVDSARKLDLNPPVISHTQPFTATSITDDITVIAKITDNGIIRYTRPNEAPRLYYRKNSGGGWTSYSFVNAFQTNGLDSFFFIIPGSQYITQVEYYFAAQDISLPDPRIRTLPSGGSGINPPGTTAPGNAFQFTVTNVTSITTASGIPSEFRLHNNFPNPFNPSTTIKFDLPASDFVSLKIFDVSGREISSLINSNLSAGYYSVVFDANGYSSGIYFYRLQTKNYSETRRMVLIK